MQNLEQVRARNAIAAAEQKLAGANGGEVIKKIPPLIINHGLLAIGAYAFDEKTGYKGAVDAIAKHLADPQVALLPAKSKAGKPYPPNTNGLMEYLSTDADSNALRLCTNEAMEWLNYARRFIKKS